MRKSIGVLLNIQPFFALLAQRCKLKYTDKCPTAAVRIIPGEGIELLINPEFFFLQSDNERIGLLWHELLHISDGHLVRYHGLEPKAANISMDESINQFIRNDFLPKRAILPEFFKHKKGQSFEVYYNLHAKQAYLDKHQQQKKYKGGIDDKENKEKLKDQIKKNLDNIDKKLDNNDENKDDKLKDQNSKNQENLDNQNTSSELKDQISKNQEEISDRLEEHNQKENLDQSSNIEEKMDSLDDLDNKSLKDIKNQQEQIKEKLEELDKMKENEEQRKKELGDSEEGSDSDDDDTPQVLDNHELWDSSPGSEEDKKEVLRNILNKTIEDTTRLYGSEHVPNQVKETLKLIQKPKVKWEKIVRNYFGRCLTTDYQSSRMKPNKKFDTLIPGKSQSVGPKLLIAIDWSGSVSDEEYVLFMTEVSGLVKNFSDRVRLVFFDVKIFNETPMIGADFKQIPPRQLRGGTDFQCVIDYAQEYNPNLLVILTDGGAPVPKKPRFPVLWAICGGQDNPSLFGLRVLIENNAKVVGES